MASESTRRSPSIPRIACTLSRNWVFLAESLQDRPCSTLIKSVLEVVVESLLTLQTTFTSAATSTAVSTVIRRIWFALNSAQAWAHLPERTESPSILPPIFGRALKTAATRGYGREHLHLEVVAAPTVTVVRRSPRTSHLLRLHLRRTGICMCSTRTSAVFAEFTVRHRQFRQPSNLAASSMRSAMPGPELRPE